MEARIGGTARQLDLFLVIFRQELPRFAKALKASYGKVGARSSA